MRTAPLPTRQMPLKIVEKAGPVFKAMRFEIAKRE
jgi:hypothetical protein